jgi:hypothetical protein
MILAVIVANDGVAQSTNADAGRFILRKRRETSCKLVTANSGKVSLLWGVRPLVIELSIDQASAVLAEQLAHCFGFHAQADDDFRL